MLSSKTLFGLLFLFCAALVFVPSVTAKAWATAEKSLEYGFLDVTQPPYSVDNTGKTDVTSMLQSAIEYARLNYLVVYLPLGTYLVSDTLTLLELEQWNPRVPPFPAPSPRASNNTHPCRFQPNVLVGERAKWSDGGPTRPVIRLKDNAPGFNNSNLVRPVVDITRSNNTDHKPTVDGTNFNQLFRGIDVTIGEGTPYATGVQLPGAQGCSVQDSTITVGSGYSGITGGSGAGGGHAMVTIIGGRVGLDYTVSLNAPGSTGMTLLGQTEAAIVYSGLEAASFTGAYIRPANQKVPALKSTSEGTHFGQVSMLDSVIEYPEGASAACVAMDTIHSLYLSNVYLKNCDAFVSEEVVESVAGGPWYVAEEIAVGVPIPTPGRSCGNLSMPIYVDGKRLQTASLVATKKQAEGPDPSVLSQHIWDEKSFPTWDAPNQINAKDYGAVGDGTTDDAPAIQKAIDVATEKRQVVFLPKGFYRLSRTLNLTCPGLVGTARSLTVLMPMSDGLVGMGTAGEAFPVLHVGNTNDFLSISMLSIVTWEHLSNTYALLWENTNPGSIYRQNYFYRITECLFGFPHPTPVPRPHPTMPCKGSSSLNHPLNLLINGASGKFYNFENEDFLYETPTYRHLMVEHGKDLKFYNLNMEHSSSESNAEFRNSDNVFIYSLKSEGEWRDIIFNNGQNNPDVAIWVRNCSNFYAYSYGGNLKPLPTGSSYPSNFAQLPPSLYRFENTCPLKVTNLVDQISFPKDDDWNFIYDQFKGDALLSEHCDRPVLYSRTTC